MATNQQRREAAKRKLERQLARRAERAKRRRIIGIGVTIGAVVVVAGLVVILATRDGGDPNAAADQEGSASAAPSSQQLDIPTERVAAPERAKALPNPTSCEYPKSGDAAKQVNPPNGSDVPSRGTVEVTLQTTQGDIPLTLDRSLAPCAVNSFVSLAKQGFYTDTSCHRISTTGLQMLQCGDPTGSGSGGPGYTFADEVFDGLTYGRGILAMANSGPDTNGSQFFMVYGNAPLDPNYTVFGTISDAGLKVIDKVARGGHDGRFDSSAGGGKPNIDVKFTGVTVQDA